MAMNRGDIWFADLPEPVGSGPGLRRPVLIVQENTFNSSPIRTVVVAAITQNLNLAKARGNVAILPRQSGLGRESVVNVSQLFTVDKSLLLEYVGTLSDSKMNQVDAGLRLVLALEKNEE
jgi:mRNA interferase MazF